MFYDKFPSPTQDGGGGLYFFVSFYDYRLHTKSLLDFGSDVGAERSANVRDDAI